MTKGYHHIRRGDDPELPRSVKCPRCRAEPGESCHMLAGDIVSAPPMDPGPFVHLVRYDLAKRVRGEETTFTDEYPINLDDLPALKRLENAIEILQDALGLAAPTIEHMKAPAAIKHRGSGLPIGESIETWAAELETPLRELLADLRQVLP